MQPPSLHHKSTRPRVEVNPSSNAIFEKLEPRQMPIHRSSLTGPQQSHKMFKVRNEKQGARFPDTPPRQVDALYHKLLTPKPPTSCLEI